MASQLRAIATLAVLVSPPLLGGACAAVTPWPVTVPPPDSVLMPPSNEFREYTRGAGLSVQWERTAQHCGQVRHAIAREVDLRNRRVTATRRWLLAIGSLAGLATTVYSGVVDAPSEKVLIPLGVASGSSLTAALPSLSQDERGAALSDKLAAIRAAERATVEQLNLMERALLELALLQRQQEPLEEGGEEWRRLQEQQDQKYGEIGTIEEVLRVRLTALGNECS